MTYMDKYRPEEVSCLVSNFFRCLSEYTEPLTVHIFPVNASLRMLNNVILLFVIPAKQVEYNCSNWIGLMLVLH